jgi:hypothetical protein
VALDLNQALGILSTVTLIGALIFAALQVRAANRARADQAALAIIEAIQSEAWTHSLGVLSHIAEGAKAEDIDALGPEVARAIEEYGLRLETVGYMVFRGFISLDIVEEMIGGITVVMWSRIKPWAERDRVTTGSPRQYEWFQWLAEQLQKDRKQRVTEPAYLRHAAWRRPRN